MPALQGDGHIVHDLMTAGQTAQAWPGEVARAGLRSALTVPIVCSGTVVGAVRLSHRRSGAYLLQHQQLLQKAANLLGPPIAHSQLQARMTSQSALEDKLAHTYQVLVSSNDLETAFRDFASAVGEIFPVEWVTLSWDNGTFPHSATLTAQVASPPGNAHGPLPADCATLSAQLLLGEQLVGTLTVGQNQPDFNTQEQTLLDRVAPQIAAAVQSHRYYRRARTRAYQIAQIQRSVTYAHSSVHREESDHDLLVDAAHALRNPVTAIKGYSSSLLQGDLTWSPEIQQEFLKTIDRETDRLEQVVRDLLAPPDSAESPDTLGHSANPVSLNGRVSAFGWVPRVDG
ncbi:MAG: GAF domain-containing protein [Dehalococcoidia bacterium]|nr:GAF domain-containing protein [Dehalococcoidia bacterium]MSQ17229.1 GAF domain-containing protein [Dehalococcoidia bacterium]